MAVHECSRTFTTLKRHILYISTILAMKVHDPKSANLPYFGQAIEASSCLANMVHHAQLGGNLFFEILTIFILLQIASYMERRVSSLHFR